MRNHRIAVQTPTNVKIASFDQDCVEVLACVDSSRFVGSARIGWRRRRRRNGRRWKEGIFGSAARRCFK
jgi:hypothetical protein